LAVVGLSLSLLSGCADKDLQSFFQPVKQTFSALDEKVRNILPPPGSPPDDNADALPADTPKKVANDPAPPAAADPAAAPQTAALPPPKLPSGPTVRNTSELVGLDSNAIERRLGSPALRRRDAPAELWQYRSPLCVMDLFLYSDGGSFRVTHVELHSRSVEQVQAPSCLASFTTPEKPQNPTTRG
jgi:hypothetical protein